MLKLSGGADGERRPIRRGLRGQRGGGAGGGGGGGGGADSGGRGGGGGGGREGGGSRRAGVTTTPATGVPACSPAARRPWNSSGRWSCLTGCCPRRLPRCWTWAVVR